MSSTNSIPLEKAIEIMQRAQKPAQGAHVQPMLGCLKFSKEELTKMCFHNPPENRGCKFINELSDESE